MKQKRNTTDLEYQEFVKEIFEEAQKVSRAPIQSLMYELEGDTAWDWVEILMETKWMLVDPLAAIAEEILSVKKYSYWKSLRDLFQPESPRISSMIPEVWLKAKEVVQLYPIKLEVDSIEGRIVHEAWLEEQAETDQWNKISYHEFCKGLRQSSKGKKLRKLILKIIPFCQECGSKESLYVIHISCYSQEEWVGLVKNDRRYSDDPRFFDVFSTGYFNLQNLLVLCRACQYERYRGYIGHGRLNAEFRRIVKDPKN